MKILLLKFNINNFSGLNDYLEMMAKSIRKNFTITSLNTNQTETRSNTR